MPKNDSDFIDIGPIRQIADELIERMDRAMEESTEEARSIFWGLVQTAAAERLEVEK